MTKETSEKMNEIRAIEDKYGLMLFRMGLTHLVEMGVRSLSDEDEVERCIKAIMAQGAENKENGIQPILSPEYQCEILCCAAELAQYTIWTLFRYIKEHVIVDN